MWPEYPLPRQPRPEHHEKPPRVYEGDKIGTEPSGTEWFLYGYFVFAAAMLFAMGFLFGWYLG